ncbi:MAG: TetR/AcrR family transcriptional regulator [Deltaproteobacteria bacterium]|nr:TetR/AcrR family transcriptional regulator [Deltaproteobacteria bacterium]MBW2398561.1 TetR/AcrR family transcriptional regulator [Deltaproteobacteria bacterium]MBW2665619.1 TetR/AcrR family transcriptional regulator [Deltaproteobacteria bacterium]
MKNHRTEDNADHGARGSEGSAGLLTEKPLTPAQRARRERLCEAARTLASEGGYSAVTMRAVAQRASVGPATVYRYFSSKDHLIADVHAQRSLDVLAEFAARPPRHKRAADRVAAVFRRMLAAAAEDPELAAAGVAAINSADPTASSAEFWNQKIMASYMRIALRDEEVGDSAALGELLGHVFFSLMCGLSTGRMTLAQANASMDRAIALTLH